MDILQKLDMMTDTTVAGDVATNTAKGKIDVIGGECPKGTVYDKVKKVCVPSKNESSVSAMVAGSSQTRVGFTTKREIIDLARKEKVEDEHDDPTETNILGRKGLKFDKQSGAYIPDFWSN